MAVPIILLMVHSLYGFSACSKAAGQSHGNACCSDGFGLNYTLPMFDQCKKAKYKNGSMIQTIPKLIPASLAEDTRCRRKSKLGIPPGQRICKFPDCLKDPCSNGWCEETMTGYQCHCQPGYSGKQCRRNSETGTTKPIDVISTPDGQMASAKSTIHGGSTAIITTSRPVNATSDVGSTPVITPTEEILRKHRICNWISTFFGTVDMDNHSHTDAFSGSINIRGLGGSTWSLHFSCFSSMNQSPNDGESRSVSGTMNITKNDGHSWTSNFSGIVKTEPECAPKCTFTGNLEFKRHNGYSMISKINGYKINHGKIYGIMNTTTYRRAKAEDNATDSTNVSKPTTEPDICGFNDVASCPEGWLPGYRKCYLFSERLIYHSNKTESKQYCDNLPAVTVGGVQSSPSLLVPENDNEDEFLRTRLLPLLDHMCSSQGDLSKYYWINCERIEDDGYTGPDLKGFRCSSGDTWTNHDNWRPGEPNGAQHNEDCVILGFYRNNIAKWNDYPCNRIGMIGGRTVCQVKAP